MAIDNKNLYPPIVDTYMPAFLIESGNPIKDTCRVYFSISSFNKITEIKNAQITVSNQNTNLSMLNPNIYPSEIMIKEVILDSTRSSDDKYYIEIKKEDMINGRFEVNEYYKVQIRFTSIKVSDDYPTDGGIQKLDSWIAANLSNFSEWSTVCLVRGISSPTLKVKGVENLSDVTYWSSSNVDIVANLTFKDSLETETLKSYNIKLYNEDKELLTDSGILYSNNYNNINSFIYTLEYELMNGNVYTIRIDYTTQNLYSDYIEYQIIAIQGSSLKLEANIDYILDESNGRIGVVLTGKPNAGSFRGNITIRRTSNESNFTLWEDVYTVSIDEYEPLNYTWWDYTIKSGIWYKYCAQQRDNEGQRGIIIKRDDPQMILLNDIFIVGDGKQLKWRLNPQVSSYKRTVSESVVETIGSKYPFINRNGNVNYKQFSLSGLISWFMDENELFITQEDIYKTEDIKVLYDDFNSKRRINLYYDFTYEREFREKVLDFLYDNQVRLFKSPTEGNMLIKLTNINLTPQTNLGRRIYLLSATAYEIDDCTIKNCDKYNISNLGEYTVHADYSSIEVQSLYLDVPANKDVLSVLKEEYSESVEPGYEIKIESLSLLTIAMQGDPYLIEDNGDNPRIVEQNAIAALANIESSTYLGYLIYINSMPIVLNKDGIYELNNGETEITSFSSPMPMEMLITYKAKIQKTPTKEALIKPESFSVTKTVGQVWGPFKYKESLLTTLWNKYYLKFSDFQQSLFYLNDVKIEATPGTIVYVKEAGDNDYERHIIGETQVLNFYEDDVNIEGLYFAGIHFTEADENESQRDTISDYLFKETNITLDGSIDMKRYSLIRNGVYILTDDFINKYKDKIHYINVSNITVENRKGDLIQQVDTNFSKEIRQEDSSNHRYIWYNDEWWLFPKTNDLLCDVVAMVDYICEILRERYE